MNATAANLRPEPEAKGRRRARGGAASDGGAANLMERVLPQTGLRQWVLSFPFPWRRRLTQDGALFGKLTRIFVKTVQEFYAERAAREGALGAKTGAVTFGQRTSSDLRSSPASAPGRSRRRLARAGQ